MIVDRLTEPHMGVYFDEKLIIPLLDGGLKIIQVDSKESRTIEATIDTAILNNYVANHPEQPLELSIQSFGNTVLTDVLEGRIKSVNIYNLQTKKIDYAESFLFKFEQPAVNPVACYDNKGVYYVQYTPINSNASAPQRPEYPQEPDYATMNAKDVKKAEKDYHTKQLKYENELTRYEELYTSYVAPENNIAHVYSDVKGVKEIVQIPQAKKITIYGDILIAEKENNIDVYDIKTGKLKLTLTPPSP